MNQAKYDKHQGVSHKAATTQLKKPALARLAALKLQLIMMMLLWA